MPAGPEQGEDGGGLQAPEGDPGEGAAGAPELGPRPLKRSPNIMLILQRSGESPAHSMKSFFLAPM